jgi:hypothetical protein
LIRRQRNGGQDADDRDNDHQFDKGETCLDLTLHVELLRGWVGTPGFSCERRAMPETRRFMVFTRER